MGGGCNEGFRTFLTFFVLRITKIKTYRLADVFGREVHDLLVHGPFVVTLHDSFLKTIKGCLMGRHINAQLPERFQNTSRP